MKMNLVNYQNRIYCFVDEDLRFRTCLFKKEKLSEWLDDHGIEQGYMTPRTWAKFIKEMGYDTLYPQIPKSYVREDVVIDLNAPSRDFEIMSASEAAKFTDNSPSQFNRLVDSEKFPAYEFYDTKRRYWRKETVEHYQDGYRKSNIIDIMQMMTSEQYDAVLSKVESLEKIYISTNSQNIYLKSEKGFEKIL
ncbi:hypothetical protein EVJ32_04705 [Exiguobacterium sp. SH5S4]|uniref:hypothetical protein n=1 Tax=Exiguobacterium sp. SH5S4 TaxID=2510961 RepID=UPI00103A65FB|nr:hypothetical protein [Exiguobacterium sp. SH5S4]TCI26678.1 hypothetical protein EVJ32_04705 [Exiguobacterium sp. SH5S4]